MPEKPTGAFVLSLLAGIFILLGGIAISAMGSFIPIPFAGAIIVILGLLGMIFGIIIIFGSMMINSGDPSKVKNGGIIVLIFSILSLITSSGGFIIGFILGLIGGILALTWKPAQQ
ncbi:MAG: DUF6114 domain-containing protein, partial [Thermoprotei archaeon]